MKSDSPPQEIRFQDHQSLAFLIQKLARSRGPAAEVLGTGLFLRGSHLSEFKTLSHSIIVPNHRPYTKMSIYIYMYAHIDIWGKYFKLGCEACGKSGEGIVLG